MKYLGSITNAKDLVTKEYVDNCIGSGGSTLTATELLAMLLSGNNVTIEKSGNQVKISATDTVTKVKGNAESSYRSGNVNLTPANIGAAASSHTHTASEVGAAASNHTHTAASIGAAASGHTHNQINNSDGVGEVVLVSDSSYYYLRPHAASKVYCGSLSYPWYKTFTERLEVTEDRIKCQPTYDNTTSYATNVYVGTTGMFTRSTKTSSRTIKHDIKPVEDEDLNPENLYELPVVQFKYNQEDVKLDENDCRYDKNLIGFIIEDMDEKFPIAVDKPTDNVKDWSWNDQYMIPAMLKLIQEQKKELDELNNKVKLLERQVNK